MSNFDLSGYKTVPERLAEFREKYPDGRLCAANPARPYYIEMVGTQSYVIYAAAAYRTPDDPCPGIGVAWEPVPGLTTFTKNSELQNAETSAWGRAVVAALVVDPGNAVASREDVTNRAGDAAHEDRVQSLRARITQAGKDSLAWVNQQKFSYPWNDETCDAIEAFLERG